MTFKTLASILIFGNSDLYNVLVLDYKVYVYGVSEEYIWVAVSYTNPDTVSELINMLLWHHGHRAAELSSLRGKRASLVAHMVKNLPAIQETQLWSLVGKIPWRREWQPTPVFLPGEFHGERSVVGYSPWVTKKIRHDWVTNTHFRSKDVFARCFCHRNWYYKNRCKRGFLSSWQSLLCSFVSAIERSMQ